VFLVALGRSRVWIIKILVFVKDDLRQILYWYKNEAMFNDAGRIWERVSPDYVDSVSVIILLMGKEED
jgi:hypothetical protein